MESTTNARAALLQRIQTGARKSEEHTNVLKRKNTRYTYLAIIGSALGTVISATAATVGPAFGQGAPAWKLTCAAAAVCTGCAAVFTGLQKQLTLAERLAKATACAGKLTSLEFALTINNRETAEVAKEYESVIATYPEIIL